MSFVDLDERRRGQDAMSADRRIAFGILSRPTGLRMAMGVALEEGAERLQDESYEITSHGGMVYGFWVMDLANQLELEASRL
jgi:hypothetical protein